MEIITSRQNPRIKTLVGLRDKKGRDKTGTFLVEGMDEIRRAKKCYPLKELYSCPELESETESHFRRQEEEAASIITLSPDLMRHCAYRENPTGLLAVFESQQHPLDELVFDPSSAPLLLLAGLEKPGNIGAIARTAAAAGCGALGFCDPKTDLYNPNIIRSSRGHWFNLKKAVATPSEWAAWLRVHQVTPVRTIVNADKNYWDFDWQKPVALLMGAEHEGLDPLWEDLAPDAVTIPMAASVDSLNVSVSAALLLYEIKRQRA